MLEAITLKGKVCTLLPLSQERHDDLVEAIKDGELWKLWYTFVPKPELLADEIDQRLEGYRQGNMLPFVVIHNETGQVAGMSGLKNIDQHHRRAEIGGTWFRKSIHKSGINTDSKKLMLEHVFETLDYNVVEIRTHVLNHQSRHGIERVGAKLDGILRNNMVMPNGTTRDTCVYSIIKSEWPMIKAYLNHKIK